MHYTSIVLQMIEDRPILHESLRQQRRLLATLNQLALALKMSQESWQAKLASTDPNHDPSQRTSQSLELAIQELSDSLPNESSEGGGSLALQAAMAFIRRHMPYE